MNIVTHNGPFHADDALACAILRMAGFAGPVIRTRDPKLIEGGGVVVDVGGVYDPTTLRFDHHQKGGAGVRPNGVPYSSAGLVWRHFGASIAPGVEGEVESDLIWAVDALDCGYGNRSIAEGVEHHTFSSVIAGFNPCWHENETFDDAFARAVEFAHNHLRRVISSAQGRMLALEGARHAIANAIEGKIIVLDRFMPVMQTVVEESADALFLVFPQADDWLVQCVPPSMGSFGQRKPLPEAWSGLRNGDLAAVTGVADSVFCHNARFIGGARSREGAIALAKLALG